MHGSRTHDLVNIVIGQDEPISEYRVLTNAIQNRTALQTEHHVLLAQRQFVVERLHASTLNPSLMITSTLEVIGRASPNKEKALLSPMIWKQAGRGVCPHLSNVNTLR